jgi:hypothetical protein
VGLFRAIAAPWVDLKQREREAIAAPRRAAYERAMAPLTDEEQIEVGRALGMVLNTYGLLDDMEQSVGVDILNRILSPHPESLQIIMELFEGPLQPWLNYDKD